MYGWKTESGERCSGPLTHKLLCAASAGLAVLSLAAFAPTEPGSVKTQPVVQPSQEVHTKPNILWLVVEDTSPWMAPWGDSLVSTPTLDKMSREGVTFLQAYAPNPICSPSRSALMTGKYPVTDGVHNHRASRDPAGRDAVKLPAGQLTLPELFRQAGYKTFNIGKDDYNFVYNRRALYSEGPDGVMAHLGELKGPDFDWAELAKGGPFFGQIQLEGGKNRVEARDRVDPLLVTVPPYYPDTPEVRRLIALHYGTIRVLDRQVAEILDKLDATGEADNTAVFVISDHGMQMLRHKQFLYDGGLHVPVFVRYPKGSGNIRSNGSNRSDLVSLIDLSATALGLANIPVPDYFEGQNLFAPEYRPKHAIFASRDLADYTFDRIRLIRTDRYAYLRNYYTDRPLMQPQYRDHWPMMRQMKELYAAGKLAPAQARLFAPTRPREELYDTATDPHQIRNLADDPRYASIKAELSTQLDRRLQGNGDKAATPLSDREILAILAAWQEKCVDPECLRVVRKYGMPPATAVTRSFNPGQSETSK